eukprot:6693480-Prymnesium_polylepis.3
MHDNAGLKVVARHGQRSADRTKACRKRERQGRVGSGPLGGNNLVFGVPMLRKEMCAPPTARSDNDNAGELSFESLGDAALPLISGTYLWLSPRHPTRQGRFSPRCESMRS